jgi:hypothetical protein
MAGVPKRGCSSPDDRIDALVSVVSNLTVTGATYTAGCGIDPVTLALGTITPLIDNVTIVCSGGILSAAGGGVAYTAGDGIDITAGVISAVADETTMTTAGGLIVCNSLAFKTIHVTDQTGNPQTDLVAESFGDTLNLIGGVGFVLTTSSGSDSVQIDIDPETFLGNLIGGAGIAFDGDTIDVELETNKGLEFDVAGAAGKLRVKEGAGIYFDSGAVAVEIEGDKGLEFDVAGAAGKLRCKAGTYIELFSAGISVDLTQVSGYEAGQEQWLKNDFGVFKWVTQAEC